MKRDEKPLCQRVLDFWDDNIAKTPGSGFSTTP